MPLVLASFRARSTASAALEASPPPRPSPAGGEEGRGIAPAPIEGAGDAPASSKPPAAPSGSLPPGGGGPGWEGFPARGEAAEAEAPSSSLPPGGGGSGWGAMRGPAPRPHPPLTTPRPHRSR